MLSDIFHNAVKCGRGRQIVNPCRRFKAPGGDYRKIVEGVNSTLDSVIGPLNVAADYVDRISRGAIPDKITNSYNGDFNAIKNNLNTCIDALNGLVSEMTHMSDEHNKGDIDVTIPAEVPGRIPGDGHRDQ